MIFSANFISDESVNKQGRPNIHIKLTSVNMNKTRKDNAKSCDKMRLISLLFVSNLKVMVSVSKRPH